MDEFIRPSSTIRHNRHMNRLHREQVTAIPSTPNTVLLLDAIDAVLGDLDAELAKAEERDRIVAQNEDKGPKPWKR